MSEEDRANLGCFLLFILPIALAAAVVYGIYYGILVLSEHLDQYTAWKLTLVAPVGDPVEITRYPDRHTCDVRREADITAAFQRHEPLPSLQCVPSESWWQRASMALHTYKGRQAKQKRPLSSNKDILLHELQRLAQVEMVADFEIFLRDWQAEQLGKAPYEVSAEEMRDAWQTFLHRPITTDKPLAEMTKDELEKLLQEAENEFLEWRRKRKEGARAVIQNLSDEEILRKALQQNP